MNIGSISSGYAASLSSARTPEASETRAAPDNDGDSDDSNKVAAAPAPTVNSSGQVVGQLVNAVA